MPWVKLDDDFWRNPKTDHLHGQACELYVMALSYCGDRLNDGILSDDDVNTLLAMRKIPRSVVDELTRRVPPDDTPFWVIVPGGYKVHNFLKRNREAVKVREERLAAEVRKNAYLERQNELRLQRLAETVPNGIQNGVPNGVRNTVPDPVPDPDPVPVKEISPIPEDSHAPKARARTELAPPDGVAGEIWNGGQIPLRSDNGVVARPALVPAVKPARASPARTPRAPDPMWDAMAAAFGYNPRENGTTAECDRWNVARKRFVDAGVSAPDLDGLVEKYKRLYPTITYTPLGLANNLSMIRTLAPPPRGGGRRAVDQMGDSPHTSDEIKRKWAGRPLPDERNHHEPDSVHRTTEPPARIAN